MGLIDKSALVAEIRRRFDEYSSSILKHYDACKEAKAQELGKILTILDTLEVKEIKEPTAADKGMAEEIIFNLKRVEQDYYISLAKEIMWLRNKLQKGE